VGRKRIFELNTVSFKEFVNYKTGYRYEDSLGLFFELEKESTRQFLIEYLNFGGYPRLLLAEEQKKRSELLMKSIGAISKEIFRTSYG